MPTIAELEEMVKRFPGKPFPRYGLAMELKKAERFEEAVREFGKAIELDPNYVAAYFHCGMAQEAWGKVEDAKATYRKGLEVSQRIGNAHTASEIGAALEALLAKG